MARKSAARLGTFEDLLAAYAPEVRRIARRLRQLVRAELPGAEESVYLGWRVAMYRDGREVCGIGPLKGGYCNLYFMRGAELADFADLLEGAGKGMRHVKVRSLAGLPDEPIKELIRAAHRLAQED
jgi:hypothetical protein